MIKQEVKLRVERNRAEFHLAFDDVWYAVRYIKAAQSYDVYIVNKQRAIRYHLTKSVWYYAGTRYQHPPMQFRLWLNSRAYRFIDPDKSS